MASIFGQTINKFYIIVAFLLMKYQIRADMLTINEESLHEQKQIIHKLYKRFAYPSNQHLRDWLQDADVWVDADSAICDVWKRKKKHPPLQWHVFPLLQKLMMLLLWISMETRNLFSIFDDATQLNLAVVIDEKKPSIVRLT